MLEKYHPKLIEPKWQEVWEAEGLHRAGAHPERPKLYVLEMFPYPSGNMHMGHARVYVIGDLLARYWRMHGRDVFHPMGFDAFGLPAENAAIREKIHPRERTLKNIETFRGQLKRLGLSYDWEREIITCEPEYYRFNQWLFIKMFEKGLVYRRRSLANWCTGCLTILANEQVVEGRCERCQSPVVPREIPDWALRITRYADELLRGLDTLTAWPERVVTMQRNWIGRSEGCELTFPLCGGGEAIRVFTTRADTVFGATYMVLAPEHPLVERITTPAQRGAVQEFVQRMARTERAVRTDEKTAKEGVFTGAMAHNPFSGEDIPVWIANFVLAEYGTGAVMSVPAHDQRDFEFAKKYQLPIRVVIAPAGRPAGRAEELTQAFVEDGVLHNSGPHDGKGSAQARRDIAAEAQARGQGGPTVNYHLRDWGISRQRYWGTPIPMLECERCGTVPVPYEQLPVRLPPEAPITGTGESPLSKVAEFVHTTCPGCGGPARRDTDTMDTFFDSSWYFARYLDPKNERLPFDRAAADRYLPVDIYIGGPEHAVMHLLYFRFFTRVMRDLGLVGIEEPARRLVTQGMVVRSSYRCPKHGYRAESGIIQDDGTARCGECRSPLEVRLEKMSKSKHNGVSPEAMFEQYGADTARLFCLFAAPPEKDIEWSDAGVAGCFGFLRRVWALLLRHQERFDVLRTLDGPVDEAQLSPELKAFHRQLHRSIERVRRDIEREFQFNTAIAALMELCNACKVFEALPAGGPDDAAAREALRLLGFALRSLTLMLAPFAPHFAEEAWEALGMPGRACLQPFPTFDPALTVQDIVTLVVQVNGKVRANLEVPRAAPREEIERIALSDERVRKWTEGKAIRRLVVVPGRLINIVL